MAYCSASHAETASTDKNSSKEKYANIETIVVTGERRTENLMKTPIAASVIGGAEIQNRDVVNVNSLQFIAPNITINDLGQGVDFNVRGIGKGEHNTQTPVGRWNNRDTKMIYTASTPSLTMLEPRAPGGGRHPHHDLRSNPC